MHIISVNVGMPRDVLWKGRTVRTAIFKDPDPDAVPSAPDSTSTAMPRPTSPFTAGQTRPSTHTPPSTTMAG